MASYKVPQDVEADDKLIGPFSFRQFIYLMIVAGSIGIAWGLGTIFLPLAAIPIPIIVLFSALALPLKKDQPMETYLAAILSYYLRPRIRIWEADGIEDPIDIAEPEDLGDQVQLKDLSQSETEKRLNYLASIADTKGWAIRGVEAQPANSAVKSDIYFEAQQAPDILSEDTSTSQTISKKLDQSSVNRRQAAIKTLTNLTPQTIPEKTPKPPKTPRKAPVQTSQIDSPVTFNPYPDEMKQTVVQPLEQSNRVTTDKIVPKNTSNNTVSADIINLASSNDLTIETIAREANRINKKNAAKNEVIISLH